MYSENKIIMYFGKKVGSEVLQYSIQQTYNYQTFPTTRRESTNNHAFAHGLWLWYFCIAGICWILDWSTPGPISFPKSPDCKMSKIHSRKDRYGASCAFIEIISKVSYTITVLCFHHVLEILSSKQYQIQSCSSITDGVYCLTVAYWAGVTTK